MMENKLALQAQRGGVAINGEELRKSSNEGTTQYANYGADHSKLSS